MKTFLLRFLCAVLLAGTLSTFFHSHAVAEQAHIENCQVCHYQSTTTSTGESAATINQTLQTSQTIGYNYPTPLLRNTKEIPARAPPVFT